MFKYLRFLLIILFLFTGCLSEIEEPVEKKEELSKVEKPNITIKNINSIAITTITKDAVIFYSIDGSIPNQNSMHYTNEFEIEENIEVKAIAYKDGMLESEVANYLFENIDLSRNLWENFGYTNILNKNQDKDNIVDKLSLPKSIDNKILIEWEISRLDIVDRQGNINRPTHTAQDEIVTIIANANINGEKRQKEFVLTIKKYQSDLEEDLYIDRNNITISRVIAKNGDPNKIVYDLEFIDQAENGSTIVWKSQNPGIISDSGVVYRPDSTKEDKVVKLIGKFENKGFIIEKEYEVVVKRESRNDSEAVILAFSVLTESIIKGNNDDLMNIDGNLNLISMGIDDTKISWESSNEELVSSEGFVFFKNAKEETVVTLKALIIGNNYEKRSNSSNNVVVSNDAAIVRKEFAVIIPKYEASNLPSQPIIRRKGNLFQIISLEDVYYTLDGSDPTDPSNPFRLLYTEPFYASDAVSLKVVAFDGSNYSSSFSSFYSREQLRISLPPVPPPPTPKEAEKLDAPVIDPNGFTSAVPLPVTITSTYESDIYYTTNGTQPSTSSSLYSSPITVSSSMTIKAIAYKIGYEVSDVSTASFTILSPGATSDPVFSIDSGVYTAQLTGGTAFTISAASGATIYYTKGVDSVPADPDPDAATGTDGTDGTTTYVGAISSGADGTVTTIKAIAREAGYDDSSVVTLTIEVDSNPTVASIQISPSNAMTVETGDAITFSSTSYDGDGDEISGYGTFTYTVNQLSGDADGAVVGSTITTSGEGTITVTSTEDGGQTSTSGTITVVAALTNDSFIYNGTQYDGIDEATSGDAVDPEVYDYANISITSPTDNAFDADAFFTLSGTVTDSDDEYQYAFVRVIKGTTMSGDYNSSTNTTVYWLNGNFDQKIWLRFGAGSYTVNVYKAVITNGNDNGDSDGDLYDGDINGWSYYTPAAYTFTVNNTNAEDGQFLYPSMDIQSDNATLSAKAVSILTAAGVTNGTNYQKALAIHDWVVKYLYYDDDSLVSGERKKQDALTTYTSADDPDGVITATATATAVCEGYTSLFAALARSQGIRTKAIAGLGGGGAHAWNSVEVTNGGGTYMYLDCTWDDPGQNDASSTNLTYDYFWQSSLSNHTVQYDRPQRAIKASTEIIDGKEFQIINATRADFYEM